MCAYNMDRNEFEDKCDELIQLATQLAMKHLLHRATEFFHEVQELILQIRYEIEINCLTYSGGSQIIENQIKHFNKQDAYLTFDKAKAYFLVKKEQKEKRLNLTLAQIGFVAGGAQAVSGAGVCAATLGIACASYGIPMMLHGTNNTYENGYYLLYRKNKSGTVRDAYRYVAHELGYGNKQGDYVYGAVDLSLTGWGGYRKILLPREKSWSLFRHIRADYIRGWQQAGTVALSVDALSSVGTGWQLYVLKGEGQ
ncbi:DUF4225 domain-containing protein [Entomohabitans teleogrylli]|uniref:DUF4225 domain-containing protein n=1 Tax=Entomohabitans teleogrylli TaxID=1384589 RepID=UPI00073DB478|nr:DUF4225 domain-containing protein [Entomohabitans teleogrylli]